jgi:hypothetical protein
MSSWTGKEEREFVFRFCGKFFSKKCKPSTHFQRKDIAMKKFWNMETYNKGKTMAFRALLLMELALVGFACASLQSGASGRQRLGILR